MAAAACFENAQALLGEAGFLLQRTRTARAAAFAVIAAEEFAKSVIYLVAALMPDQRAALPARIKSHEMKHWASDAAEAAEIKNKELWDVQPDAWGYAPSAEGRLEDMAVSLCGWGLRSLTDRSAAKAYFGDLRRRHKQEMSRFASLTHPAGRDVFLPGGV